VHDPEVVLAELHAREVRSVLLEGGPTLVAAFVRAGLVDAVRWYVAPALLGAGPAALGDAGMSTIAEALRLEVIDVARVGDDVRIDARVRRAHEEE
jgi:diaminohydroxyphosphoribosylaminopyrimidine deaminase/5-amino-6-(5-phosphoribosylamino)uracil reductase